MTAPSAPSPAASCYGVVRAQFGNPHSWPMVMTAHAVADLAIAELNAHLAPGAAPYPQQDPAWTRVAAATYPQLRDHDAATNPPAQARPDPPLCRANRDELRAWLTSPAPDAPGKAAAQRLQLDDTFTADAANVDTRLWPLLVEAQHDGVFHPRPRHRNVAARRHRSGHRLPDQRATARRPELVDGAHSAKHLFGDNRHGIEAAVNALSTIAHRTNIVLAEQTRLLRTAAPTPPTATATTAVTVTATTAVTVTATSTATADVDRPPPAAGPAFAARAHAASSATPTPAPAADTAPAAAHRPHR